MAPEGGRELEEAGVIDSKFGPFALLREARNGGEPALRPLIGRIRKALVFMQHFAASCIIVTRCGPIDLVTICLRRLK
jgi:hypothetical protein